MFIYKIGWLRVFPSATQLSSIYLFPENCNALPMSRIMRFFASYPTELSKLFAPFNNMRNELENFVLSFECNVAPESYNFTVFWFKTTKVSISFLNYLLNILNVNLSTLHKNVFLISYCIKFCSESAVNLRNLD